MIKSLRQAQTDTFQLTVSISTVTLSLSKCLSFINYRSSIINKNVNNISSFNRKKSQERNTRLCFCEF